MEVNNFSKGLENKEQLNYIVIDIMFDTSHLRRKKINEFWNLMKTWDWTKDRELFWLAKLIPNDGESKPLSERIPSSNLLDRIYLLFEVLSKLFPKLNAVVHLEYGPSETLWNMGIANYGGYLTIALSNGKVIKRNVPII